MSRPGIASTIALAWERLLDSVRMRAHYAEPKMMIMGGMGVFGTPLYYAVWAWWYPQPYESIGWRLAFSLVALPLLLVRWWPARLRRWIPLYWYLAIIVALPYFFAYMMLMNSLNTVWLMSHLAAVFIVLLIFDLKAALVSVFSGTVLAVFAYIATPHAPAFDFAQFQLMLPVWAFVLVSGGVFNVSRSIEHKARIESLTATAATIAHELRTPLAAIRLAAMGSLKHVDAIVDGYLKARAAGLEVTPVHRTAIHSISSGSRIIQTEVNHAFVTIEMLLAAARPAQSHVSEPLSAEAVVAEAVRRYPYASPDERAKVQVELVDDFRFSGAAPLMLNVLFNLLKNAIHHTTRAGQGDIRIRIEAGSEIGRIIVRDSGPGIPAAMLPRIFDRFVTGAEKPETGLGIGLAFCRDAVQRMGGIITCRSEAGHYAEFTIAMPMQPSEPAHES